MQTIEPVVFYTLILILVCLILLLIGLVVSYVSLLKKYLSLKEGSQNSLDPGKILSDAQAKSLQLLENAHIKARDIISAADKFLNHQEEAVLKELEKASQIYTKHYNEVLANLESQSIKTIQNIPKDIEKMLLLKIGDFEATLKQEVAKSQKDAADLIRDTFRLVQEEVENYKKERMLEIDKSATDLTRELAKKVLGKEINPEEHEKLVIKALEEAKRQGIL